MSLAVGFDREPGGAPGAGAGMVPAACPRQPYPLLSFRLIGDILLECAMHISATVPYAGRLAAVGPAPTGPTRRSFMRSPRAPSSWPP